MAQDIYQGRKGSITGEILNFRDSGAVRADSATSLTDAEQAQARANIGAGASNRNLLDNGWFTVNQRGQASYSTHQAMTVDRWRLYSYSGATVITPTSDGITIDYGANGGDALYEVVPKEELIDGETYTFSAMMQDGTVESTTFTLTFGSTAIIDYATEFRFHIIPNWGTGVMFGFLNRTNSASTVKLRAAKLEKGAFSTLSNDTPPNYAEELAKGQRYAIQLATSSTSYGEIGFGTASTVSRAVVFVPLPVSMRTQPTKTLSGTWKLVTSGNWQDGISVTAITVNNISANGVSLYADVASGLTVGQFYKLAYIPSNPSLLLSADLA